MKNASRNLKAQEVAMRLRGMNEGIPLKPTDLELVIEFYDFLTGTALPKGMSIVKSHRPKLSEEQAITVIWFLQEHLRVLPDHYERCDNCGALYDSHCSGYYSEKGEDEMHFFCDSCEYLAPMEEE